MSQYNGVATLESWLANEMFNVERVPSYVVERFEQWREGLEANLESYFGTHDGDGLASWRDWGGGWEGIHKDKELFMQLGLEAARLLGVAPPAWNQRTGLGGVFIPITPDWVETVGLSVQTNGAPIPTISMFTPLRFALGAHQGAWFVALKDHLNEIRVVRPIMFRFEVFKLCEALNIELPVAKVEATTHSRLILPGM